MATDADVSIRNLLNEGRELLEQHEPVEAHQAFGNWVSEVADWLDAEYGDPAFSARWSSLRTSRLVTQSGYHDDHTSWVAFRRAVQDRLKWLATTLEQNGDRGQMGQKTSPSRKVFVVHGRDDATKHEVALFLSSIGLEPIILHTRPHGGRHILTKFKEESEGASFAVILMTPDDEGALIGETLQKRARQNVVFELGFFIGMLSAPNVAALVKGNIEKPSDFDGIGYIDFDPKGEWKRLLAREMHHVQIPFDASKVLTA